MKLGNNGIVSRYYVLRDKYIGLNPLIIHNLVSHFCDVES